MARRPHTLGEAAVKRDRRPKLRPDVGRTRERGPSGSVQLTSAAAAGVQPVDGVFADFRDPDGLRAEATAAACEGFTGKLAIHPDQVAVINAAFAPTPEQIAAHKRLVEQAVKAFASQHYDHYDFLLTISDNLGGNGLEHHRSSEDGVGRGYFTDWDTKLRDRNLLPHE